MLVVMSTTMSSAVLDRPVIDDVIDGGLPGTTEPPPEHHRWHRLGRSPDDPRWVRPALLGLLVATGVLYLWGLGASGWANSFYSAAAQAGSQSWKAMFFGSSDASNLITVDKPPAALWAMALSVRIFGLNAWSILVPEALMGVASVGVLYATVKRWFGAGAGLLAGAVLAVTPVATLMFRFNNPDAMLVLVLTLGAYCLTRALEAASTKWVTLAFALVGLGFLTKMLQALLVLPAFGLVYLLAAPTSLRRRIVQLTLATVAFVAAAGWWVAIVELVPASMRPYVGGSQDNSVLDLIFGYNGFGRLSGNETGSVGGGTGSTGRWGATGWLRLFNAEFGGQASWLLPAALVLMVGGIVICGRAARTDRTRAALGLWGGWLLVTGATFSLGQGIIHPYYTVALAPALGALVGIGGTVLWRQRSSIVSRGFLVAAVALTGWWATELLARTPDWNPWLRPVVAIATVLAVIGLLLPHHLLHRTRHLVVGAAIVAALITPTAASIATAATPHSGSIPSAAPASTGGGFGGGGQGGPGGGGGGFGGGQGVPGGQGTGTAPTAPGGTGTTGGPGGTGGQAQGGGVGGLLNASTPSSELTALLDTDADQYDWVAAAIGANSAAGYQLATGDPVMAIGGFNGSDPWPTLEVFQQYVAEGRVHYFIASGTGGQGGGSSGTSSEITAWVTANFTATTVGGTTVYDLTATASSAT
jgi:4-amino-4-deoxy-L-arabinose transferase-like glycosyltransferase